MTKEFWKLNWLNIIGLIVGVVGIAYSWYTYTQTQNYRLPIFVVNPARTEILSSANISQTPLRVIKLNGDQVKSDLTAIQFYFWNQGNVSIKKENILSDLVIRLSDNNAEIIDYKIVSASRAVTWLTMDTNPQSPKNSLVLSFSILEYQDGMTGQIIYEGSPNAGLEIAGIIEGVKEIYKTPDVQEDRFWTEYTTQVFSLILLVSLSLSMNLFVRRLIKKVFVISDRKSLSDKENIDKLLKLLSGCVVPIFFLLIVAITIYMIFIDPLSTAKENAVRNIVQDVPLNILPDRLQQP